MPHPSQRTHSFLIALLAAGIAFMAASWKAQAGTNDPSPARLRVTSPAFVAGETIPTSYTCSGDNISPELNWTAAPAGTKSITVIGHDPDAPSGDWVHWVIFNLPAASSGLPQGVQPGVPTLSQGIEQGVNDFRRIGYDGPCPPPGAPHHYHFEVYALDIRLSVRPGATRNTVAAAMRGHILAKGDLVALFGR